MATATIQGLDECKDDISFRIYRPEAFELDSFRSLKHARLPYEHFPMSMQFPITKYPRVSAMLLALMGVITEEEAELFRYKAGIVSLTYADGYHFIQIPSTIRTIMGYLNGQRIGYPYPQAFRFERDKGWNIEKVIEWLGMRFKLKEAEDA